MVIASPGFRIRVRSGSFAFGNVYRMTSQCPWITNREADKIISQGLPFRPPRFRSSSQATWRPSPQRWKQCRMCWDLERREACWPWEAVLRRSIGRVLDIMNLGGFVILAKWICERNVWEYIMRWIYESERSEISWFDDLKTRLTRPMMTYFWPEDKAQSQARGSNSKLSSLSSFLSSFSSSSSSSPSLYQRWTSFHVSSASGAELQTFQVTIIASTSNRLESLARLAAEYLFLSLCQPYFFLYRWSLSSSTKDQENSIFTGISLSYHAYLSHSTLLFYFILFFISFL